MGIKLFITLNFPMKVDETINNFHSKIYFMCWKFDDDYTIQIIQKILRIPESNRQVSMCTHALIINGLIRRLNRF